jgi:hypothetical protein
MSSPVASLRSSDRQGGLAACKTLGKPAEAAESALFGLPDERTRLESNA